MTSQTTMLSIIIRLQIDYTASFSDVATAVGEAGGDIIAVDVIRVLKNHVIRDITVNVHDNDHQVLLERSLRKRKGIEVINISDRTFLIHLGGKIEVHPKRPIKNRDDLSRVYTPDVARICSEIHADPSKSFQLTIKRNTVAVITDGSAVLGLGDIGPEAAMPVMEGKAMLFKQFADVDAFPICLSVTDEDKIIESAKAIASGFGGINLEDISSPRCFHIEDRLRKELDIPVFHDDQHGTAVVVLAGLMNALKIVRKSMRDLNVVICGIGAAGVACTKILLAAGVTNIIGVDKDGIINHGGNYDNPMWSWYAENTNPGRRTGTLADAVHGADAFIGLSRPNLLTVDHIKSMASDPIVFAMANPNPEVSPEVAEPLVRILATGRSDYPNQVNNLLCFPGIFRGALDARASDINEEMKLAAARAIAACVHDDELNEQYIIPSVFNQEVVKSVSKAVFEAAVQTGVARRETKHAN